MDYYERFIKKKQWSELIKSVLPVTIPTIFSFKESIEIAGNLFDHSYSENDQELGNAMRDYATNILLILRNKEEGDETGSWKDNWSYEALLGVMCGQTFRKEEAQYYLENTSEGLKQIGTPKAIASLREIIENNEWRELLRHSIPSQIANDFSFEEAMQVAGWLYNEDVEFDSETKNDGSDYVFFEQYIITLLTILRMKHTKKWQSDWKNEAFLGSLCSYSHREYEGFKYLMNTYKAHTDPPAELIVALIDSTTRGHYFLPQKRIIELCEEALDKELSYTTAIRYAQVTDNDEWRQKAEALKNHTPQIIPDAIA